MAKNSEKQRESLTAISFHSPSSCAASTILPASLSTTSLASIRSSRSVGWPREEEEEREDDLALLPFVLEEFALFRAEDAVLEVFPMAVISMCAELKYVLSLLLRGLFSSLSRGVVNEPPAPRSMPTISRWGIDNKERKCLVEIESHSYMLFILTARRNTVRVRSEHTF